MVSTVSSPHTKGFGSSFITYWHAVAHALWKVTNICAPSNSGKAFLSFFGALSLVAHMFLMAIWKWCPISSCCSLATIIDMQEKHPLILSAISFLSSAALPSLSALLKVSRIYFRKWVFLLQSFPFPLPLSNKPFHYFSRSSCLTESTHRSYLGYLLSILSFFPFIGYPEGREGGSDFPAWTCRVWGKAARGRDEFPSWWW